ncbi:protein of unknown function [Cupriavidus taiwanensis]|nr:protein of unknown function [Cupriavidus taiwanensis]
MPAGHRPRLAHTGWPPAPARATSRSAGPARLPRRWRPRPVPAAAPPSQRPGVLAAGCVRWLAGRPALAPARAARTGRASCQAVVARVGDQVGIAGDVQLAHGRALLRRDGRQRPMQVGGDGRDGAARREHAHHLDLPGGQRARGAIGARAGARHQAGDRRRQALAVAGQRVEANLPQHGRILVLADDRGDARLPEAREQAAICQHGKHNHRRGGAGLPEPLHQAQPVVIALGTAHGEVGDDQVGAMRDQRGEQFLARRARRADVQVGDRAQGALDRELDHRVIVGDHDRVSTWGHARYVSTLRAGPGEDTPCPAVLGEVPAGAASRYGAERLHGPGILTTCRPAHFAIRDAQLTVRPTARGGA